MSTRKRKYSEFPEEQKQKCRAIADKYFLKVKEI